MSYRDDEPAVRVLRPTGDAPLPDRPGRAALLTAAAVGAAIGFLIGGITTGTGSGERAPTSTAGGIVGLAEPGEDPASPSTTATPTTEAAAPATTASPEAGTFIAAAFSDLVPGLDGTLLIALPEEDEAWVWLADRVVPDRAALPPATGEAAWNVDATAAAALAGPLSSRTLFVITTDSGTFDPVFTGAESFAWHATAPDRIAWTSRDGNTAILHVGTVVDGAVEVTVTEPLISQEVPPRLAAWGEWGYALVGEGRLSMLGPGRGVRGEARLDLVSAREDGLLLVSDSSGGVFLTEGDLGDLEAWPSVAAPVVWAPSGSRVAGVADTPLGPALQVDQLDGNSFRSVLGVDEATMVGWAGGDRFAVMWSPDAEELVPGGAARRVPALIVVDLSDRSTHAVPLPSLPSDFRWVAAS